MGFFQDIGAEFGSDAASRLRQYSRGRLKIATLINRRNFLLRCRRHGLVPRHISDRLCNLRYIFNFHDHRTGQQALDFHSRLEHKILNLEISVTIKNLNSLSSQLVNLVTDINRLIPADIWQDFRVRQDRIYNSAFINIRSDLSRKFDTLKARQQLKIPTQERWFKNISNEQIPDDISNFLALGPKFSIKPNVRDISIPKILAEVESVTTHEPHNHGKIIAAKVTNILTNFLQKPDRTPSQLEVTYQNTGKFLRQHPEVLVTQADKGNVTVCMKKSEYSALSKNILADTQYYKRLPRDPTSTLQQKANKLITNLKNRNMIDDTSAKKYMIYNSRPARFYGLPKIHKPQLSLRPIISSLSCPNSKVAQLVTDILSSSYNRDNNYYVSDSFQFANLINDFELPHNYVLVSFDVVSLFTNIPTQLVIDSITNRWHAIRQHTNIQLEEFLQLVNFVFDSTYFTYDNTFYKQIFGTPMGSVISPIAAQLVMDDILDNILAKLPFEMPFIRKYVDDIICSIPEDQVDNTLNIFNSINVNIQFTVEKEKDFAVPFLDTLVIRDQRVVRTDWYVKPMASGRYINYHSYHPMKMKINTVLNMRRRIWQLSHPIYRLNNLNKLVSIMLHNSFPRPLLNKLIYSTPYREELRQRVGNTRNTPHNDTVPVDQHALESENVSITYRSIPYEASLSNKLIAVLSTIPGLRVAMYNTKTVRNLLTPLKDKTPILQQSGVVYQIPCATCPLVYIGQTSRTVSGRITSHRSDARNGRNTCQLAKHVNDNNHVMNYDAVKILDTSTNYKKRTFLEMVRISQNTQAMNSKKDIDGLSHTYIYLLQLDFQLHKSADQQRREGDELPDVSVILE